MKWILIIVILILGGVGYIYYQNKPSDLTSQTVDALLPESSKLEKEIVGTQSQIILNELDEARDENLLKSIKSKVQSAMMEAELYFDQKSGSYLGLCAVIPQAKQSSYQGGASVACNVSSDGRSYALQAFLPDYGWCVDSARNSLETKTSIGTKTSCK